MASRLIRSCETYIFGDGAIHQVGGFCEDLGIHGCALLVCDEITHKIAGEQVADSLMQHGFVRVENSFLTRGACAREIENVRSKIRSAKADIVFGIGGGAILDVTKVASSEEGVGYVTVPTSFATNAMSTRGAVVWNGGMKSVPVNSMIAVVVDSRIVRSAPWKFQAAGFADYLAKVCALHDWYLAHHRGKDPTYSEYGAMLARAQCDWLMKNAASIRRKEDRAFDTFLQILMTDGFLEEMAGRGRIAAGSEHIVSEALDKEYVSGKPKPLHGETVALGLILMSCWQGQDWRTVRNALEEIGAPVTAEQIGYERETMIRALLEAEKINMQWISSFPQFHTILLEKPLTRISAEELAKSTGVIG